MTVHILHVRVPPEVMRYVRFARTLMSVYCTHDHTIRTRDICFTLPIANSLKRIIPITKLLCVLLTPRLAVSCNVLFGPIL